MEQQTAGLISFLIPAVYYFFESVQGNFIPYSTDCFG